jgi:hypothetical protein
VRAVLDHIIDVFKRSDLQDYILKSHQIPEDTPSALNVT